MVQWYIRFKHSCISVISLRQAIHKPKRGAGWEGSANNHGRLSCNNPGNCSRSGNKHGVNTFHFNKCFMHAEKDGEIRPHGAGGAAESTLHGNHSGHAELWNHDPNFISTIIIGAETWVCNLCLKRSVIVRENENRQESIIRLCSEHNSLYSLHAWHFSQMLRKRGVISHTRMLPTCICIYISFDFNLELHLTGTCFERKQLVYFLIFNPFGTILPGTTPSSIINFKWFKSRLSIRISS